LGRVKEARKEPISRFACGLESEEQSNAEEDEQSAA